MYLEVWLYNFQESWGLELLFYIIFELCLTGLITNLRQNHFLSDFIFILNFYQDFIYILYNHFNFLDIYLL